MKFLILTCALCLTATGAMAAQADTSNSNQPHQRAYEAPGHIPIGEPGSGAQITRTIELSIIETENGKMLFEPDTLHFEKGAVVRFVIKNEGALDHEFFLGSFDEIGKHQQWMRHDPEMQHTDPNSVNISSGYTATLDWKFSSKTNLEFVCLIPGHREAGMWGVIMIHDHFTPNSNR